MTTRSKTFGYTVLMKMQQAAETLSKEHNPKKIQKLKKTLDGLYEVWERSAERRKEKRLHSITAITRAL